MTRTETSLGLMVKEQEEDNTMSYALFRMSSRKWHHALKIKVGE